MTRPNGRVARLRSALADRVDPLAARRVRHLADRHARRVPLRSASASAVQDVRTATVEGLTHDLRRDPADPATRASLAPLAQAWLAGVDAGADPATLEAVTAAFGRLWQPAGQPVPAPPEPLLSAIVDPFHRLYYSVSRRTWKDTWYRGIATYKCPTDMWVYQELIDTLRPALVIETGTFRGGSALFLADRLATLGGPGEVVTIDVDVQPDRPEHPRLTYLTGSSVGEDVLAEIARRIPADGHVLVILDSDHSQAHVAAELAVYAPLVTVGSYLVVEDTNVNGHPTAPEHGPGPWEATQEFLAGDPGFEVDPRCERYFLTQNPQGYLRRVR